MSTDIKRLRELAAKADAVDASQHDRELTIYYDYPGCVKDQECRVATAWCVEWAHWIAATTPGKMVALFDELAAARLVVEAARVAPDDLTIPALAAYDAAVADKEKPNAR